MRVVDTKGLLCPAPLIAAKKALRESAVGEQFVVLTDNNTSFDNLSRFLKDNKVDLQISESEGVWTLTVTKTVGDVELSKVEDYCETPIAHFEKGNFVVVFTSDKMGDGDEDLGHLLIGNFIKALKDLDKLPGKMVFYNKGVTLAAKCSPVIEHLKDLQKMGVELLLCATCVNHYSIQTEVGIGILSNMFEIANIMTTAGRVIRP
jgi:selenium metabolism protein YedF